MTAQGLSPVLVVCVFFTYVRLCPRVPTGGGKARVTRGDVAHLYCLAHLCEDGCWPCSLTTPHPADTPAIHISAFTHTPLSETCYFSLFWADFPKSLMTNRRGFRSPVPRWGDWLLIEEWKQPAAFPSQLIMVWLHPFCKGLREVGNGTAVVLALIENLSPTNWEPNPR